MALIWLIVLLVWGGFVGLPNLPLTTYLLLIPFGLQELQQWKAGRALREAGKALQQLHNEMEKEVKRDWK